MSKTGSLEVDPVFLALTRPAMILGVSYSWLALEGMMGLMGFVMTSRFDIMLYAGLMHIVGLLISRQEPRFIDLFKVKASTCSMCKNAGYYGNTHSYDVYR